MANNTMNNSIEEINESVCKDGLNSTSSDRDKLLHVWSKLQESKADLEKAVQNEETLKKTQETEMKEVEDYVEHIRRLSDERETLIQELEAENECLKNVTENKTESSTGTDLQSETKDMLMQQGLHDICNSTTNEQIAFLLMERARLLDEMESEQLQPTTSDADTAGELKQILERERHTFDEQLTHQRASSTLFEDKLKSEHEEEINCLMDENGQLEDELADEQAKVKHLTKEMERLKEELEKREEKDKEESPKPSPRTPVTRPPSPARNSSDLQLRKIIEDKTKLEGELISLRSQIRMLEEAQRQKESEVLKVKSDMERIQMENERLEVKNSKLKSHLEETETQLDETENTVERLTINNDSLTKKLAASDLELQSIQEITEKDSNLQTLVEMLQGNNKQLQDDIESLNKRLETSLVAEDDLSTEKTELLASQADMNLKLETILTELEKLKLERDTLLEEKENLVNLEDNQNTTLTSLNEQLTSLKFDLDEKCKLQDEQKHIINTSQQESTKQELIIQHMREQNQKLTKQLTELKENIQTCQTKEVELQEEKESLEMSSKAAEKRCQDKMEDLQTKLKLTLEELTKSKTVIERTLNEKQDLVTKLSMSDELDEQFSHTKHDLENSLLEKSDLESKIKDLELSLVEKTQQAEQFEDERNQRIELEKKMCDMSDLESELFSVREELERESRLRNESQQKLDVIEELFENQKLDQENILLDLQNKVSSLEKRNEELEEDLFNIADELQVATDQAEKAEKELEVAKINLAENTKVESVKTVHSAIPVKVNSKVQELEKLVSVKTAENDKKQNQIQKINEDSQILTKELHSVKKDLQDTVGKMNSFKTKVEKLEIECDTTHQQLVESEAQIDVLINKNKQLETKLSKGSDVTDSVSLSRLQTLQLELQQTQSTLQRTNTELETFKQRNANMEQEKMAFESKSPPNYSSEERESHLNRITSLEEISRQLEVDNREMAKKLSETMLKTEVSETKLERQQTRVTNIDQLGNRHAKQLEDDIETANRQIRTLREDLHNEQAKVFRLEAENVGQKAKYESIVKRLETEVSDIKEFHHKEIDNITSKLDVSLTECQQLKSQLREKEEEVINQENETARMKSSSDRVEAQIETEIKLRTSVENRNKQQEQEITKVWAQVRSMMEKCSNLENTKHCLEEELSRLMSSSRQTETIFVQKSASQEANITSLQMRADQAERKNDRLQRELEEVGTNLKKLEQKARESESSHLELEDQKDFVVQIKNKFESEKLQRTLLDQTVIELKHQVNVLKQRDHKISAENRELQHTILDLESRLNQLQDEKDNKLQMQNHITETGKQTLMEQIVRLQTEVKDLQYELLGANEKQEMHEKRYENRKLRTKEKLLKAREFYSAERSHLQDQMQLMDEELRLSRSTLRKEVEWRDKIDSNYKHILQEKRDLISNLTEQEEILRDRTRSLSMIQVRMKYMEEENSRLQNQIESLNNQRITMEKIAKTSKQTEEGSDGENCANNNLDNSLDSNGWQKVQLHDSQVKIVNNGKSPRLGKYVSAVVDLYQDDSDESFDQEFDA